jgi:hypothetical protein
MEDIDIWRSANLLIQNHGPDAIKAAAMREVEMLQRGDEEGAIVWQRIILAIDKLMRGAPHSQLN